MNSPLMLICGVANGVKSWPLWWGLLKLKPKCESIEADLLRSSGSEKVADVGSECERPGGVLIEVWMVCEDFSESFFFLMIILISSLCLLRKSLLLHHIGLLYSH